MTITNKEHKDFIDKVVQDIKKCNGIDNIEIDNIELVLNLIYSNGVKEGKCITAKKVIDFISE